MDIKNPKIQIKLGITQTWVETGKQSIPITYCMYDTTPFIEGGVGLELV